MVGEVSGRRPGLAFIMVTLFLDVLGIGLIVPILPRLLESFVGNDPVAGGRLVGAVIAVYALMQFIFSPVMGSLSDRYGRRPVLLAALTGQGLDYLLLAFAPSLPWFFVGRVISGITGASLGTAAAYIADVSPPEKRSQSFGLIGLAFGLGFVAGPLLSAFVGAVDVRLPFLVSAGLSLLNAVYGLMVLPESLPAQHRRPFSWARANPFGTLRALGRYPVVIGLAGAYVFILLAQRGLESVWVLYTEHRFHWTVRDTGLSLALVGVMAAVVQGGVVRRVLPRIGERRAILIGNSVAVVAFVLYGLAWQGWMMYVIIFIGSAGGIAAPAVQGLMSRAVPPTEQGMLQGGLSSLSSVTAVVGPLLATNLFSTFIGAGPGPAVPGMSFFVGAGLIAVGLSLAMMTLRRLPPAGPAPVVVGS